MTDHAALSAPAFSACRRSLRSLPRSAAVSAALLLVASLSSANVMAGTFVDWVSLSGTGTADGVTVTSTFSAAPPNAFVTRGDLSGSNFNPPGSANEEVFRAPVGSAITWSFDKPVEDFLLYVYNWRGSSSTPGGPSDGLYTFDQTPTIQSGLAGLTISGNSLDVGLNSNNFYSGILSFPGPLTSLSLAAPVGASSNLNARNEYTMSFNAVPVTSFSAVPEPSSSLGLAGLILGSACLRRRKRA